jgi:hypothetical protein
MECVQALKVSKKSGDSHGNHDRYRQQRAGLRYSRCKGMRVLQSLKTTKRIPGGDVLSLSRSESVGRSRASYCLNAQTASVDESEMDSSCIVGVEVGNRTTAGPCQT